MSPIVVRPAEKLHAFKFVEFVGRHPEITKPWNVDLKPAAMRGKIVFLFFLENERTLVQGTRLAELF